MNKARNLIEHEEEIFSRPPRVWFQSKADLKRKSGKRSIRSAEFEVLDSFNLRESVLTQKWNFTFLVYVFLSADKAANGPASKKSKNENKKGKIASNANENVRLPFSEFRCFPFYFTIRRCDNCFQLKISSGFSKNSISTNHVRCVPYFHASLFNNVVLSLLNDLMVNALDFSSLSPL